MEVRRQPSGYSVLSAMASSDHSLNRPSPAESELPQVIVQSGESDAERSPLLGSSIDHQSGLSSGSSGHIYHHLTSSFSVDHEHHGVSGVPRRHLGILAGVFSPVALSMFSTVLFLRLGFVVGQAGILQAIVQFLLAYSILALTILSICAISTNGAIEGGGAYYMISRALGPEFGGSIGLLFFLANVFSCALYLSGFVEGLVDNFGPNGSLLNSGGIPAGSHWWSYLYCTISLGFCLVVCLIGGAMFARTSVFILLIVFVCTLSVAVSMCFKGFLCVPYPDSNRNANPPTNHTQNETKPCGNYTGFNLDTFQNNVNQDYQVDYITERKMDFATVFAILFSSVTGIMNGANLSGELKEPSKAIPRGTMSATCFTLGCYLIMSFLTSFTCTRDLLINNYNYLQDINLWPPFVVIGIFATTLSAALGNLIGASRILEALARDDVFGLLLRPAKITNRGGNPYVSVLISWFLVQCVLLIGSLNAIAPMASELFLLSYAATNLACLGLDVASAPNFRPTFKFFSWWTALLGLIGCLVMCFLINPIYASVAIILCLILTIGLHLRDFPQSWGSISQALIFHQVRKYLLMLDSRKDHVKFWRPQILLLVANPRSCSQLIDFVNDLKKGGLYVLGHIKLGDLDAEESDPCQRDYTKWQSLVDHLKVKAFVELTLSASVREGMHHLVRVSGLGGMKPNTICFGFYDNAPQEDTFIKKSERTRRIRFYSSEPDFDDLYESFPNTRGPGSANTVRLEEYVHMIYDALKMNKNVCLFRHFPKLDKSVVLKSKVPMYIDVWPVNLFTPSTANYFDNTCLFMLQLACILHMVPGWKKTKIRIFLCVESASADTSRKEKKLKQLLRMLRILGKITIVTWDHVIGLLGNASDGLEQQHQARVIPREYIQGINELLLSYSTNTAVSFCYLPTVPEDSAEHSNYLTELDMLTTNMPPTVLVHGIHPVTSTTL